MIAAVRPIPDLDPSFEVHPLVDVAAATVLGAVLVFVVLVFSGRLK